MYVLTCKVEVGNYIFNYVNELNINSSWQTLTDTAIVKLPRNLSFRNKSLKDLIKVGDAISITLGYNAVQNIEFRGFVARIEPNIPFVLYCEDAMWQLKQTNITKSFKSVNLHDIINLFYNKKKQVDNIELGTFRINGVSPAKVLDVLKRDYGIVSYFRDGVFYSGLAYQSTRRTHRYHFQKNIIDSSLNYRTKDDVRIKLKAISLRPDNSKIEYETGDVGGELRTLHFYDIDAKTLQQLAKEKFDLLKYDGYDGSFKAFGLPYVVHGDVVDIQDNEFSERAGLYFVDSIAVEFGINGFRRIVKLGKKAG